MRRAVFLSIILIGVAAPPALSASGPKWTAEGAITTLRVHSVTVHGHTCRITTASPIPATLHLFYVGAEAKMACASGVLRSIDPLRSPTVIKSSVPVQTGGGGTSFTWVAPFCGSAPKGQDTYTGSPASVTCASGTLAAFGPASSGDSCTQAFVVGQPAGFSDRICGSATVGSLTCGIVAFFYSVLSSKYAAGQPATIGCTEGVLQVIKPVTS